MKISKLFHWLYAILMLMPIFAIGVSCLYVIFNKNAKDSYSGENIYEINYKYQSNEVNSVNDIVDGNIYKLNATIEDTIFMYDFYANFDVLNGNVYFNNIQTDDLSTDANYLHSHISNFTITSVNGADSIVNCEINVSDIIDYYFFCDDITFDNNTIIRIYGINDINKILNYSFLSYTDYNEIESVNIDNSGTLDYVFYYSINQLKNNSLFNWSRNSFLSQPITYITDLFGMDNDNIVIYLLSYWLDISIIWLVFDLVMYVPLVIHRWIDKGVLE